MVVGHSGGVQAVAALPRPLAVTAMRFLTSGPTTVPTKPLELAAGERQTAALPPIPSVASAPVCYGTVWIGGLPAGSLGADTVAITTGLRIEFIIMRTPVEPFEAAIGVAAVSHPDAVLWVQVGDLHYRVTADDLPWRTPIIGDAKGTPISEFGVCLGG